MNKRILLLTTLALVGLLHVEAQRTVDVLDRGLVALQTADGVFCSWRIPGEEWYDVKYNIYRDGTKLNAEPLSVSNFLDDGGNVGSKYSVCAVIRGEEQEVCKTVEVWEKNYLTIVPKHDGSLTSVYVPNDATCADVDGDGELEILMKYDNESEISNSYPKNGYNGEYSLFECLKMDGTVLWWVNCGPNMGDFQNNEQNIAAYDWDGDGKAEAIMRAADGTTIHQADGTVYTVGDASINYRAATGGGANWFMHSGREYLLYLNAETGEVYQCIDYPLPRLEENENPNGLLSGTDYDNLVNKAWGDGYGHRSSKHFFGAPYLDGRKPSIFIARGIYTRHKMVTYDVNPETHELVERWRWNCDENGSPWFGQGYHNYSIADVDWDGRDEIVFGSMVIDDNGRGLSTTGLGHGDSHHVGDFDPYSHGQEIFACNEDRPGNNFRDATTSKLYYRYEAGNDDGRANMGKFIDEIPGAQGVSSRDPNLVGGASHAAVIGLKKADVSITQNFRIFWDGDLCDESFDYANGKNSQGAIFKAREGRIAILEGSKTNNDTKGTPCFQGDILGDWREEVMMRDGDNNIRIYTTDIPTKWRIYSLWHDHQYRNAMVWQMCGYNQTPHVSYYLGEMEGITIAPPPLIMTGRTEVKLNETIGKSMDGQHLVVCEDRGGRIFVEDGAQPSILTVNTPKIILGQGPHYDPMGIGCLHVFEGGAFAGEMRLVKQGDSPFMLPNVVETYSGPTEIWAGTLMFDGTLQNSHLWLNRFAGLTTDGGKFMKGIDMKYSSVLKLENNYGKPTSVETDTLSLGFGAIVELDLYDKDISADKIKANVLKIEKKDWQNGPQHLSPILRLRGMCMRGVPEFGSGKYLIGEIGKIDGNLNDFILEGLDGQKKTLVYEDGRLYIDVVSYVPGCVTWAGVMDGFWDIDNTQNFLKDGEEASVFVPGDEVTFDDKASTTDVEIRTKVAPKAVIFNNETKDYSISGEAITGEASLTKNGGGKVTLNSVNSYTGGTFINGGTLAAGIFANSVGTDLGALGDIYAPIYINNEATLATTATVTLGQPVFVGKGGGTIEVPSGATLILGQGVQAVSNGDVLIKTGAGALTLGANNTMKRLVINGGRVNSTENASSIIQLPETVEFLNGSLYDVSDIYSYSTSNTNFVVPENCRGNLYLDARCNYKGKLSGKGTLTVFGANVRNELQGNWSAFEGTLIASLWKSGGSYDAEFHWSNGYGMPKATLSISSGTNVLAGTNNFALGNLAGTGTLSTTGTLTIGSRDEDIVFGGTLSGPTVVKVGAGDWKVSKAIGSVKKVTVREGALALPANLTRTNQNVNFVGSGIDTYIDGAMLRGQGTLSSVYLVNGGTIEPGYYSSGNSPHYGTITMSSLNIDKSSSANLYIRTNASKTNTHSNLTVSGKLTFNGTLCLSLDEDYQPVDGEEFVLWRAGSFVGSPSIVLPQLPEGFVWDDSSLLDAKGILRVVAGTGISDLNAESECTVFAIDGREVGTIRASRNNLIVEAKRQLHLSAGIYMVRMNQSGNNAAVKIVVR